MNTLEWLEDKTNLIMMALDDFFTEYKDKYLLMNNYPIICDMFNSNNDLYAIKNRTFDDPDVLYKALISYQKIISTINLKQVVFVPSKENFCMFLGWTTKFYNEMLENSSENIKAVMDMINDYIIDAQLSAGQKGFLKANLTKFRAQVAGEHGNSLVTQKEQYEMSGNKNTLKSKEQLIAELEGMGFKQIDNSTYPQNQNKKN